MTDLTKHESRLLHSIRATNGTDSFEKQEFLDAINDGVTDVRRKFGDKAFQALVDKGVLEEVITGDFVVSNNSSHVDERDWMDDSIMKIRDDRRFVEEHPDVYRSKK